MNRLVSSVLAYLNRGARPDGGTIVEPPPPPSGPAGASRPTALDVLDGHYADARAVVDPGRRPAVDTGPLLATGPDIRPAINVDLLRQVLEHITTYPRSWVQDAWWESTECGTSGCVAGWAVQFAVPDAHVDVKSAEVRYSWGLIGTVESVAREALDLTFEQASQLFSPRNRLRDLWTLAAEWSRGAITVPDELPDGS